MSDVTGTILLLVLIIGVMLWAWGLADAFGRPVHEWDDSGKSRQLWITLLGPLGFFASPVYLLTVRPVLEDVIQRRLAVGREHVDPSVLDDVEPVPGSAKPDPILVVDGLVRRCRRCCCCCCCCCC